jgi:hypothetical protein
MEANVTDVDDAVAKYRRRVQAEAELAETDLDELEEHLRELTEELRTAGMSAAEAVTEAARRLGDPRQLAREHARVRSQFGAPLSAGRAWSAAVIFAVPLIVGIVRTIERAVEWPGPPFPVRVWLELGAFVLIAIALAARRTWARAVALGLAVHFLARVLVRWPLIGLPAADAFDWNIHMIARLGLLAFVIPWRRKEVSPAAVALVLQVWAYGSAAWGDLLFFDQYETNATIALVCAAAACIGTVHRARWSAIASAVSALALFGMMFSELGELVMSRHPLNGYWLDTFFTVGSGAIAASVAAILCWRTTRSFANTFRPVMR